MYTEYSIMGYSITILRHGLFHGLLCQYDFSRITTTREGAMNRRILHLLLTAGLAIMIFGCSNKNSDEACIHQVAMDLDAGSYDSVLSSSCSDSMQKSAAYFGKAGFSTGKVLNALIDANNAVPPQTPLSIYMSELVDQATDTSVSYLDSSLAGYESVSASSDNYFNAQFNTSLVSTAKGLSLLRLFIAAEGLNPVSAACDANGNGKPDSIDAASCALRASAGQSCGAGYNVTVVPDLVLSGVTGTFSGSIVQVTGTGSTLTCPPNDEYKRLLVLVSGVPDLVTATTQVCQEASPAAGRTWPCPLVLPGTPIGLAQAFDQSLNTAITSLNTAVTTTSASDVKNAIIDVKRQNCCSAGETWTPNNPASCTCNTLDLGNYLMTL